MSCKFSIKGNVIIGYFDLENNWIIDIAFVFSEVLRDCSLDTVEVQKDDIIILSSDGLWDVIKGDQLHQIVMRNKNKVIYQYCFIFIK